MIFFMIRKWASVQNITFILRQKRSFSFSLRTCWNMIRHKATCKKSVSPPTYKFGPRTEHHSHVSSGQKNVLHCVLSLWVEYKKFAQSCKSKSAGLSSSIARLSMLRTKPCSGRIECLVLLRLYFRVSLAWVSCLQNPLLVFTVV